MRVLDEKQIADVMSYIRESEFRVMYVPIMLAITCGMRRGEIAGLKWSDVDLENQVLRVVNNRVSTVGDEILMTTPKSDSSLRTIELLPSTIPMLNQWKLHQEWNKRTLRDDYNDEDFVCTWEDGKPLRPDYITKTWGNILKKLNIDHMRLHDLRHTHATLLLKDEVNPKVAAERLGHKDVEILLNRYSHVLPTMQKEATDKLDKRIFNT